MAKYSFIIYNLLTPLTNITMSNVHLTLTRGLFHGQTLDLALQTDQIRNRYMGDIFIIHINLKRFFTLTSSQNVEVL